MVYCKIVNGLLQDQKKCETSEFKSQSAVCVTILQSTFNMAKHLHMQPCSSKENQPPLSKWINFDIDNVDLLELSKGFIRPNLLLIHKSAYHLFQDWTTERNVQQGSWWCLGYWCACMSLQSMCAWCVSLTAFCLCFLVHKHQNTM